MTRHHLRRVWLMPLVLAWAMPALAQQLAPVRYTLSFPAVQTHYVEVDASIPSDGERQVDLMMPVWTPGSYLVREYSRNIEGLTAKDENGAALRIEKTRKNRWRVVSPSATSTLLLHYRVYAHEMSVRTNWVDEEFGLLNGAATYITRLSGRDRPYEVRLRLPKEWSRSVSSMASATADLYQAADYDTLVDSPIVAGNPQIHDFTVSGTPHALVTLADRGEWDASRAARDVRQIVQRTAQLWGVMPYDRYYFFNILGSVENGIEHKASTVLNAPRDSTKTRAAYLSWLNLASHEFFHAWNVKRLRPAELGPFDYENEVYTKSLWFVEGVTDYYGDLMVHRAGLSTRDEFLSALSAQIASLQTTPGRLVQPVELASYDAWIKYYRPDENSVNASISYYTKGAVIGFLLDAYIRRATSGARTLDDLMRALYARFSGANGFTPEEWRATAVDLVGPPAAEGLKRWLTQALDSTGELDYQDALDWFGLQFQPLPPKPRSWLGVRVRRDGQRTFVSEVRRGSPASDAGLNINDEIIAVDGAPLTVPLAERLAAFPPGSQIVLTISRRDVRREVGISLGTDPTQLWTLEARPASSPDQINNLARWLD